MCRKKLAASGVSHVVAELHLPGVAPETDTPYCYEAYSRIWSKESLFNHVYRQLPSEYDLVGWIDNDVFIIGDWVTLSLKAFDNADSVQPFNLSHYLLEGGMRPSDGVEVSRHGYACYSKLGEIIYDKRNSALAQTGFAWLYRREILDATDGLYPYCFTGVGDYFVGRLFCDTSCFMSSTEGQFFYQHLGHYQQLLASVVKRRAAFVYATACHLWHGSIHKRKYPERFNLLNDFRPGFDVTLNGPQLIPSLTPQGDKIVKFMSDYFNTTDTPLLSRQHHVYKL